MARAPLWMLGLYAGLAAAAAGAVFAAWQLWDKDESLPFLRGIFLYPVGVIDARSPELVVHELASLSNLQVGNAELKLEFSTGASFEFALPDPSQGSAIETLLKQAQTRASLPPGDHSQREGVLQNPLLNTGFKNPFGPTESIRPEPQDRSFLWFSVVIALGLILGTGAFVLRNHASERGLYVKARTQDTTAGYRAFLASGAEHQDITGILLPRAELRDAIARNSADAIEAFLDSHPKSKIEGEGVAALREALLAELTVARNKNSLTALRQFRAADPRRLLVETERLHYETALYRTFLQQFQTASVGQPEQLDFFARLLEYTRKGSPVVAVRFRRHLAESVDKTEAQVKKSAYYIGPPALPKQYFDASHSEQREAKFAAVLIDRYRKIFPEDVLTFVHGEPMADDGADIPPVNAPTLLVTHRLDMSGPFTSTKPRGAFVGLGFAFKVALIIPSDNHPLVYQQSFWMPPHLRKIEEEHKSLPEMYCGMADDAFLRLSNKYLATVFRATAQ
jgi:hypothetical protein